MSLHTFLRNTKPSPALPLAGWLFSTGARSACKETVHRWERETGLEPATACLGSRNSTTELLPHVLMLPHAQEIVNPVFQDSWGKKLRHFLKKRPPSRR